MGSRNLGSPMMLKMKSPKDSVSYYFSVCYENFTKLMLFMVALATALHIMGGSLKEIS
jgi:hypothetical protein